MVRVATIFFVSLIAWPAFASELECAVSGAIPEGSVFIGYTRASESTLRALALLEDTKLTSYDGKNLSPRQSLYGLVDSSRASIKKIEPSVDRHGDDHCIYPATLSTPPGDAWEIWLSRPEARAKIRRPTLQEVKRFQEYETDCIYQGGPPPEGVVPVCVRAQLIAVSDLDRDGKSEYWHSVPFSWDTGFRVAEPGEADGLVSIVSACPGCSD